MKRRVLINTKKVTSIINTASRFLLANQSFCTLESRNCGFEALTTVWDNLDPLTQVGSHFFHTGQLVAVKMDTGSGLGAGGIGGGCGVSWFRAVVLEEVGLGETNEMPEIHLKLIDIGTFVRTTTRFVVPLPERLLAYPPLVNKTT